MKVSLWLLATSALFLVACSSHSNQEPEQQGTSAHLPPEQRAMTVIEASCINAGGSPTTAQQLDGSSVEMCQLADGKRKPMASLARNAL